MKSFTKQLWLDAIDEDPEYKSWFEQLMNELDHVALEEIKESKKDAILRSHFISAKGPSDQTVYLRLEMGYWIAKNKVDVKFTITKVDVFDEEQEMLLHK